MRVILLGAGASYHAGYPLAGDLLASIDAMPEHSTFINLRDSWLRWRGFRDTADGSLHRLLTDPNPEVVFSALDLCDEASLQGAAGSPLHEAGSGRAALLESLRWFLLFKHDDEGKSEAHARRAPLRNVVAGLAPGDAVLTFNWDTLAEWSLSDLGLWHPTTGYGLSPRLAYLDGEPATAVRSAVTVWKLHGSVGWYRERGALYFESPFLQAFHLDPPLDDSIAQDVVLGPPSEALLLHPSYLKQLQGATLQQIWVRAAAALETADELRVYGYSLPPSDAGARVLLNRLRERTDCAVHIHDVSVATLDRWRDFLPDAQLHEEALA